ncbi:unnamed protein product [Macrosiphum euphorbiae]|uniref:DUF4806 domain-containing protein n=1 Tax=Macrosiphum euphorbiae TaxID=13131 RepID=A0AAV0XW46_9HEMI|nr:unnamed protein product [Macrosiphum euphorbiae]
MWLVVNFILDDTVEVVPQQWLNIKKGICGWPKFTKKIDVERAVRNKTKANKKEFNFFEARAMSSLIDSYTKAIKKCYIAKSKSDLSSCAEETKEKKKTTKSINGEISDTSLKSDSLPLYSTDDELEIRKSIQGSSKGSKYEDNMVTEKNLSIYKKPNNGWSPLKSSADSSFVTPTVHSLINDDIILNTTGSKSNSCEVIDSIGHTSDTTSLTRTMTLSSQNSIHKDNSHNLSSGANRRLIFSDLDSSQTIVMNKSPIMSSKTSFADNQYTKLLNYMITMKYEMRSIHEKLDILIQTGEENSMTKMTRESGVFDTSIIDSRLPIENEEKLETLETDISNDKSFRNQLVLRLSSVGGKTIKCMVKRIMTLLFTPEILCKFSYNGRGNKKRPFEKLLVKNVIFESVKTIKKFALSDNASNEIEQVIKYVLIQTPFKIKNKTSG